MQTPIWDCSVSLRSSSGEPSKARNLFSSHQIVHCALDCNFNNCVS